MRDGIGDGRVNVYGLLTPTFELSALPPNPGVMPGASVDYTVDATAIQGFSGTLHLTVDGLPAGASGTP